MSEQTVSTYYFVGKLSPEEPCANFNPGEIHLRDGWVMDIFQSGIAMWNPTIREGTDSVRGLVDDAMDTIVSTFNFITDRQPGLKHSIHNCIEARGVSSKKNLIWWFVGSLPRRSPSRNNKDSRYWRKAGRFHSQISESKNFYYKLALRDYKACMQNLFTDDAFFYAFRIAEDIRQATTQRLEEGLPIKKYWEEMHKILGITEKEIKPLTDVATKVRHGNVRDTIVLKAREKRGEIISIAIKVMRAGFSKAFKGLLKLHASSI